MFTTVLSTCLETENAKYFEMKILLDKKKKTYISCLTVSGFGILRVIFCLYFFSFLTHLG